MNRIVTIVFVSLIGLVVMFALKPVRAKENKQVAENEALREKLEAAKRELKTAKAQSGRVEIVETRVEVPTEVTNASPSPQAIIDNLINLDPDNDRTEKRAVFFFESLVDHGDAALPAIRDFMVNGPPQDKVFAQATQVKKPGNPTRGEGKGKEAGNAWAYFRALPQPDFDAFPPTLRVGFLEVIANIGTKQAETLLVDVLKSTGRGVEVAYLEMALQKMAPGIHLELILQTTRELLAELPVELEGANFGVDQQARGYLFGVLVRHKDMRFVNNAKALLVRPDGSLDGLALSYLRQVLGADAAAILQSVASDDRITDQVALYAVRDAVLHFIGQSAEADQLFLNVVKEGLERQEGENFNWGQMKLPMTALFRGLNDAPLEVVRSRQALFNRARQSITNPAHIEALSRVDGRFDHFLNPEADALRGK